VLKNPTQTKYLRNLMTYSPYVLEAIIVSEDTITCRFGHLQGCAKVYVGDDGTVRLVKSDGAGKIDLELGYIKDVEMIMRSLDYFLSGLHDIGRPLYSA
jgi:hypothetical protein